MDSFRSNRFDRIGRMMNFESMKQSNSIKPPEEPKIEKKKVINVSPINAQSSTTNNQQNVNILDLNNNPPEQQQKIVSSDSSKTIAVINNDNKEWNKMTDSEVEKELNIFRNQNETNKLHMKENQEEEQQQQQEEEEMKENNSNVEFKEETEKESNTKKFCRNLFWFVLSVCFILFVLIVVFSIDPNEFDQIFMINDDNIYVEM